MKTAREAYGLASLVSATEETIKFLSNIHGAHGFNISTVKTGLQTTTILRKWKQESEFKRISCLQSKFKVNLQYLTQKRGRVSASSDHVPSLQQPRRLLPTIGWEGVVSH